MKPIIIEINPITIEEGRFHKTLLHELCHYYLLLNGKDHKEFDEIFLSELRRVGGSMPVIMYSAAWTCSECGRHIYKSNTKRFSWKKYIKNKKCACNGIAIGSYQYNEVD